jgi:hypothetical protein
MRPLNRIAVAFRVLVSVLAAVSGFGSVAYGATFLLNSTVDAPDAFPADGVCASAAGTCTLRAAIMEANALAGHDIILLPANQTVLYLLTRPPDTPDEEESVFSGDLDIKDHLTITVQPTKVIQPGHTRTIDGNDLDRVFHIHPRVVVDIQGVIVQNGHVQHGRTGGGILNEGTLTLTNVTVRSNSSGSFSGGIANRGTLTLYASAVGDNLAIFSGGGIGNGGALFVINSTVSGNETQSLGSSTGGGINNGGVLHMIGSTVSDNSAGWVESNTGTGGGIHNHGTAYLTNSTISSNSAHTVGDGILNESMVVLINSTVADHIGEGIRTQNPGSTVAVNTIIAGRFNGIACFGSVVSAGYNLDSDNTCGLTDPTDIPGTNPLLGGLTNNGGPTETHALNFGSPAIDAGGSFFCPVTDQRGILRPQGPACDIGAYELVQRRQARPPDDEP